MSAPPSESPRWKTLALIGVGLLGGSLARTARERRLAERIVGLGRNLSRLNAAREAGLLDLATTDFDALAEADLVVVCTPVDRLAADVIAAARRTGPDATITDVGSIKGTIVRDVAATDVAHKYVPSHPLAGSEQSGWEAATPTLFENRLCVLTPFEHADPARIDRVEQFWQAVGSRTVRTTPEEHDRLLAVTSHLPHTVAAALAGLIDEPERPFVASGFRDTTRIAGGDPAVWTPILLGNAPSLADALDRLEASLREVRAALIDKDTDAITRWLDQARQKRATLTFPAPTDPVP